MSKRALVLGVVLALLPASAMACPACGCGDPTLTAMGVEKPFRNRIRLSSELRYRTDAVGQAAVDRLRLREYRWDTQIAWAPASWLFLAVTVPVLRRTVEYVNLSRGTELGLGDTELRAKFFVYQDRRFDPRHLVAVLAGVKMPTGRAARNANGRLLPLELQSGTGSWDPIVALSYAFFARPWSLYLGAQGIVPTEGRARSRASRSLRTTATLQYQLAAQLAIRAGIDTRVDSKAIEDGQSDRDSGGWIAFASPDLLISLTSRLLLLAYARLPVLQRLDGFHEEGMFYGGALAYDF